MGTIFNKKGDLKALNFIQKKDQFKRGDLFLKLHMLRSNKKIFIKFIFLQHKIIIYKFSP